MGVIKITIGRRLTGQLGEHMKKKYKETEKREGSHGRGGKAWRQGERMQRNNSGLVRVERAASSLCPDGEYLPIRRSIKQRGHQQSRAARIPPDFNW